MIFGEGKKKKFLIFLEEEERKKGKNKWKVFNTSLSTTWFPVTIPILRDPKVKLGSPTIDTYYYPAKWQSLRITTVDYNQR